MKILNIRVRNSNFSVTPLTTRGEEITVSFLQKMILYKYNYDYKTKRYLREADKIYAAKAKCDNQYRFNINSLRTFMQHIYTYNIKQENIEIIMDKNYSIGNIDAEMETEIVSRDYQIKYITELVKADKIPYKLIDLIMGKGKTYIATNALVQLAMRTLIIILPKYIDKWINDITDLTNIRKDSIYVVRGSDSLRELFIEAIEVGIDNLQYDIIIISTRTMYNYISEYEEVIDKADFTYNTTPDVFTKTLGIGVILNDETHQEFHNIFKTMLYLDAPKFMGSSATLESRDVGTKQMYNLMFPDNARISNIITFDNYIDTYAVSYDMALPRWFKFMSNKGYMHVKFEESMLRNKIMLTKYMEMICYYLEESYIRKRKHGDKALVFASSVAFCTVLNNYLKQKYSYLDVRRYVEDDPYENVLEADIRVTTVLSAGTAVDIKGLISVIQTIPIGSIQANKQTHGRLRDIGREVSFYYLFCRNIPNHYKLHKDRMEAIRPMSKTFIFLRYEKRIE